VHARAIERLDLAVDDLKHLSEKSDAAQGQFDERTAAVALAAANEQLAAREAWVKYIEHSATNRANYDQCDGGFPTSLA
jgi:hypothetical protein